LHNFCQTALLDNVYQATVKNNHRPHIICVGSTTDRLSDGKPWIYNAEKKALRDYSNTLALGGVWKDRPKITYISFGTMSNNQHKHPERNCLDIDHAASYIKWIVDQPRDININELSIDSMQDEFWYD
jgi:NADP-dependent 3-hydroxy acid dehydrogenase YdfG